MDGNVPEEILELEAGTIDFHIVVVNNGIKAGIDIIQDNLKEILEFLPKGKYTWVIPLRIEHAKFESSDS